MPFLVKSRIYSRVPDKVWLVGEGYVHTTSIYKEFFRIYVGFDINWLRPYINVIYIYNGQSDQMPIKI